MLIESFIPEIVTQRKPAESDIFFLFYKRDVLVREINGRLAIPSRADVASLLMDPENELYIGMLDEVSCYTTTLELDTVPPGYYYTDLRTFFFNAEERLRSPVGTAALLRDWAENTRYCGRCGAKTVRRENEWCSACPECGYSAYPRMSPAVIVAVIKDGKILLAHNQRFPSSKMYSLIAGFVEPGESLESTVHREVLEETGLKVKNVRYFSSQCWPFPDSLMVGYVAEYDSGELQLNEELADAGWFTKDTMPQVPGKGPISRMIIDWYVETGGDVSLLGETGR